MMVSSSFLMHVFSIQFSSIPNSNSFFSKIEIEVGHRARPDMKR